MEITVEWKRSLAGLVLAVALSACGGGGGGNNDDDDDDEGNADVSAIGVWFGSLTDGGFSYDFFATIHDQRIMLISYGLQRGFDGSYTVEGDTISASLTAYDESFGGAGEVGGAVLSGTLSEEGTISALLESSFGPQASVQLTFQEDYHRNSSLSLLEGVWDDSNGVASANAELTIALDGTFSGSDVDGCAIAGDIDIINSANNLYDVDMSLASCLKDGNYTGFARLVDFNPRDLVAIIAFNDDHMVFYNLYLGETAENGSLSDSVAATNLSGAAGSRTYYTFTVSADDLAGAGPNPRLQVVTSGGMGDLDLYVRFEEAPSLITGAGCASSQLANNSESCGLDVEEGTYHVMLHGRDDYSGVSLTATLSL